MKPSEFQNIVSEHCASFWTNCILLIGTGPFFYFLSPNKYESPSYPSKKMDKSLEFSFVRLSIFYRVSGHTEFFGCFSWGWGERVVYWPKTLYYLHPAYPLALEWLRKVPVRTRIKLGYLRNELCKL